MEEDNAYGEFEEVVEDNGVVQAVNPEAAPARARMPFKGELIGILVQRLGGNRMEIKTTDGKSRNCRVPGRFKRSMWLRPGDYVLIKPWVDDDTKGDVIYKYNGSSVNQLRKKGLINNLKDSF